MEDRRRQGPGQILSACSDRCIWEVYLRNMAEIAEQTGTDLWSRREKLKDRYFSFDDVIEISLEHLRISQ